MLQVLLTLLGIFVGSFITVLIQRYDHRVKFRLAALDKRLEAHQKAFEQCSFFVSCLDERDAEKVRKVFKDAQTFYSNYSLYLENGTRKKFVEALGFINAFCPRWDYLKDFKQEERQEELKRFHRESQKVFDLASIIQKEVQLEPIVLSFATIPSRDNE